MSSVTRFLRQIPVSTTYYTITAATPNTVFYELTPAPNSSGNYANETEGYVTLTTKAVAIAQLVLAGGNNQYLLRDMGKTIRTGVNSAGNQLSFFREVQIVNPVTYSSTFGVAGGVDAPSALTDYFTFYVPVAMPGFTTGVAPVAMTPVSGGQA